MAPMTEFMPEPVLALESCVIPGRKLASLFFFFSLAKRSVTEGVGTASVMELLSLEFPFSMSHVHRANRVHCRWEHCGSLYSARNSTAQSGPQISLEIQRDDRVCVCGGSDADVSFIFLS